MAAYAGVLALAQPHVDGQRLHVTTFYELAGDGRILDARILDVDSYIVGTYETGEGEVRRYYTPYLKDTSREPLLDILLRTRVPTSIDQQNGKRAVTLASLMLPGLILVVLFAYLLLSSRRGTGLFGVRSGAQRTEQGRTGVTFADVAGQDAAVGELREVTQFLADPQRFTDLGATVPKGVLLFGPPGCGKTLLARALAGEAGAAFYSISGSDFVELYVGVGAARVRDLFRVARENAPAIVFVDELDSVGRSRVAAGISGGGPEQEQALNQILAEMDGFSPSDGIIVVGATNRPDVLDPALLRPGRFDRTIGLERPDEKARLEILRLHGASKRLAPEVDLADLARRAIGLTGADLASLMNEGALLAARNGEQAVSPQQLDLALRRILEAPERQRRLALRERSIGRRFVAEERVTFADVAGADEAVEELTEVREYLADPDRFAEMGARVPRGVLLSGPPGCGKTLLARAVAGEANAAFFSVTASEFIDRMVGLGASRVRELFAEARSVAPAIVFIDEIDAMGGQRTGMAGGDREYDQTLNQLLTELDGFAVRAAVIVMGATNRPDLLDTALVRPGRFDRQVALTLPDRGGRRAILALHSGDKRLAAGVDLETVAGLTRGFSGADLANVLNEAALLATRRGLDEIPMAVVDEAIDRAILGISSRATILSEEERRMVAYHEAGHALVARGVPGAAPSHRLTIVPRGGALGHCTVLDASDRVLVSRSAMLDHMAVGLGGRVAEQMVFGEPGSGSGSDLERVGEMARHMVRDLGMSDVAGPLGYGAAPSDESARLIDAEARRLAGEAEERARAVLAAARPELERVAQALLERETLSAADLDELVKAGP